MSGLPYASYTTYERFESGDPTHPAYAVMPNATDTELRLITLP
jgi:hypothetical protein